MSKFFKTAGGAFLNLEHVVAAVANAAGQVEVYTVNPNAPITLEKIDAEHFLSALECL